VGRGGRVRTSIIQNKIVNRVINKKEI